MKRYGLMLAAAVLLAATGGTATAQTYGDNYPVCLQSYAPIQFIECRYGSIPQCQVSASGRAAQCIVNPYFVETAPAPRRKRQRQP